MCGVGYGQLVRDCGTGVIQGGISGHLLSNISVMSGGGGRGRRGMFRLRGLQDGASWLG